MKKATADRRRLTADPHLRWGRCIFIIKSGLFLSFLAAFSLALAASFWLAAGAAAHGLLVKSEPQDGAVLGQLPERVIAWFSQELDTGLSALQLVDAAGRQVDNGDGGVDLNDPAHAALIVTLPPSLPAGVYTAHWTAVSADDGDTTEGEFSFSVGEEVTTSRISTAETTPTDGSDWPLGWIAVSLGILFLLGLGLALRRRVKASLVLMLGLAGLVLWVQTKISLSVSAAPLASQTSQICGTAWPGCSDRLESLSHFSCGTAFPGCSDRLESLSHFPIELKPPPTPIAPLVSAKSPAQLVATPIPFLAPLTIPTFKPTPFFLIHTVQAGESLISIAARYNVTAEKLLTANDLRDPTRLVEGRKLLIPPQDQHDQGKMMPYEIREGDTLLSIASKYGSSVTAIEVANPHLELDPLSPGETIALPIIFSDEAHPVASVEEPAEALYHIVQSGETPLAIAAAYDLPVEILLTANHIGDPRRLQIGQKLIIPPHAGINGDFPVILYELTARDTLVGIASRFGSSLKDILAVNPDLDPASWEVGQLVAIPVIFPLPRPTPPPSALRPTLGPPPPALLNLQQQVIAAVNMRREEHGLSSYLPDEQLDAVALAHAQDMVARDFLAHVTPDGKTLQDRLTEGGVKEVNASSENIQRNARPRHQAAQAAVNWFMNSAPHRYNLLNEQYNYMGVGVVEGAPGWYTFVLVFGQR